MRSGRPTSDPKTTLLAVRLPDRHVRWLRARAKREGLTLSEALRRVLDAHAPASEPPSRPPTPKERREFDQVFAAFGLRPRRRSSRRRGR